ncbi:hypothetical protein F4810DRAFT_669802 [Camillea tinctor]|nr:hypothetical protein F4810DRAFT_669802 [Camillea tinctor]
MRISGPRPQHYFPKVMPIVKPKFPPATPDSLDMTKARIGESKSSKSSNNLAQYSGSVSTYEELRVETPVPAPTPWKTLHSIPQASSSNHVLRCDQPAYNNKQKQHFRGLTPKRDTHRDSPSSLRVPQTGNHGSSYGASNLSTTPRAESNLHSHARFCHCNEQERPSLQEQLQQDRMVLENEKEHWTKLMGF